MEQILDARPHIRWMIRRDLKDILPIETACFDFPWCEEDFLKTTRRKNCIGMTAECGIESRVIVGYMIYELKKNAIELLRIATHPDHQRSGIAKEMVDKLKSKLSPQRRKAVLKLVRESCLDGQLFLRDQGFKAVQVLREEYDDSGEDGFLMRYHLISE